MNSIFAKREQDRKTIKQGKSVEGKTDAIGVAVPSVNGSVSNKEKKERDIKPKMANMVESISDASDNDHNGGAGNADYADAEQSEYIDRMALSIDDIKRSIPANASKTPIDTMLKTHTEWRWRFYNIDGRKMVEISKKDPNKNRVFIDNTGRWISFSLDASLDKYVVDVRHCYVK